MTSGAGDAVSRIETFLAAEAATRPAALARCRVVAVGWATVELDRAAVQLAPLTTGADPTGFRTANDDDALGAFARTARTAAFETGPPTLVLLEPSTEGRLVATLARNDEGPAVAWLAADDPAAVAGAARADGLVLAAEHDGPLGPARLTLDGPVTGPHRFLVSAPATI